MQCSKHKCDIVEVWGPAGGCPQCKEEYESKKLKKEMKELSKDLKKRNK